MSGQPAPGRTHGRDIRFCGVGYPCGVLLRGICGVFAGFEPRRDEPRKIPRIRNRAERNTQGPLDQEDGAAAGSDATSGPARVRRRSAAGRCAGLRVCACRAGAPAPPRCQGLAPRRAWRAGEGRTALQPRCNVPWAACLFCLPLTEHARLRRRHLLFARRALAGGGERQCCGWPAAPTPRPRSRRKRSTTARCAHLARTGASCAA